MVSFPDHTNALLDMITFFDFIDHGDGIVRIADDALTTLVQGQFLTKSGNWNVSCLVPDCSLKEAYLGTTLMNDHISGNFPVLKPGLNAISWNGNVTSVVISPRWQFLSFSKKTLDSDATL